MLWRWGGDFYQVPMPAWLGGPVEVPLVTAMRSSGELVYLSYPLVRLVILLGADRDRRPDVARAQPHQDRHADPRRRR